MLERVTQLVTRLLAGVLVLWAGMELISPAVPFLLVGLLMLHLLLRLSRRS